MNTDGLRAQWSTRAFSWALVGALCVVLSGCMMFNEGFGPNHPMNQLQSVPHSEPHGTLVVQRNDRCIYVAVDHYTVFKSVKGDVAAFNLAPGKHHIEARYYEADIKLGIATFARTPEHTLLIEEGRKTLASVISEESGIFMRVGEPTDGPDLVEVQKATSDPRGKIIDAARKSGLQVTTDANGKVELRRSPVSIERE